MTLKVLFGGIVSKMDHLIRNQQIGDCGLGFDDGAAINPCTRTTK